MKRNEKCVHSSRFVDTMSTERRVDNRNKNEIKTVKKIRYHYIPNKTFSAAACAVPPTKEYRDTER